MEFRRCVLLLVVFLTSSWRSFALELIDTPSDVLTRVGCVVTETCAAADATVEWSTSRRSISFDDTPTRSAQSTTDDSTGITTATLTFSNVTVDDEREYTCVVISNSGQTSSSTIRVIVEPELIAVKPIVDYPLDATVIGNVITVGCVVSSCGTPNLVTFTSLNTSTVVENITRSGDGAFNWNPEVTNNLAGTYRCTAENPLGSASAMFKLTGGPRSQRGGSTTSTLSVLSLISLLLLALLTY